MSTTRAQYIAKVAPLAVAARQEYPALFPSLAIAQAILESGNGRSDLARVYNNHFGIKANRAWRGKVVSLRTKEVYDSKEVTIVDGFRAYDSAEDSFRDRNRFLAVNRRYTTNGVFSAPTPQEQAKALQRAGYATDPNYANKLIDLIAGHGLERYDHLPDTATSGYVHVGDVDLGEHGSHTVTTTPNGITWAPVRPPVTLPPAPPPIPIPAPPPRKRSWIDRLINWIRTR